MKNLQYRVIKGTFQDTENQVQVLLNDGWSLMGGPFVVGRDLHQGMVKEEFIPNHGNVVREAEKPGLVLGDEDLSKGTPTDSLDHIG